MPSTDLQTVCLWCGATLAKRTWRQRYHQDCARQAANNIRARHNRITELAAQLDLPRDAVKAAITRGCAACGSRALGRRLYPRYKAFRGELLCRDCYQAFRSGSPEALLPLIPWIAGGALARMAVWDAAHPRKGWSTGDHPPDQSTI